MNFAQSWKKQHQVSSSASSFLATFSPRPHAPLSFQKSSILPCSIYDQRSPKNPFPADLTPICERGESVKSSQQNTFRAGCEEPDNVVDALDISEELLLSDKQLAGRGQAGTGAVCAAHQKAQDVICLVDHVRICSHCALFGDHKDHNFKSDAQFLEELQAQTERLDRLQQRQGALQGLREEEEWQQLVAQCRRRQRELLDELALEFARLLQQIESARREAEASVREQAQTVQQAIERREGGGSFGRWLEEGRRVVERMREDFDSAQFRESFCAYDTFAWLQGEFLAGEERDRGERARGEARRSIEEMRLNLNQHALQSLAASLIQVSHIQLPSEPDFSLTSLDDLHRLPLPLPLKTEPNENEFLDMREFARFRNSECLQTLHEPGRTSIGLIGKAQRMSAKCFAKKAAVSSSKKENNPAGDSFCGNLSLLQRQQSTSKLETSIFACTSKLNSSKSKMKLLNSPKLPKPRPDPMRLLSDYERNGQTSLLSLADCNLSEDSLAYFLERAGKARPPVEVNLERNNLSANGFTKLLPYLVGCSRINLAYCGLGEGCLEALLRTKALRRLEECNLTGNDINAKKNKAKLEELKRAGIKVICS